MIDGVPQCWADVLCDRCLSGFLDAIGNLVQGPDEFPESKLDESKWALLGWEPCPSCRERLLKFMEGQ
jgi:hypothetical protein